MDSSPQRGGVRTLCATKWQVTFAFPWSRQNAGHGEISQEANDLTVAKEKYNLSKAQGSYKNDMESYYVEPILSHKTLGP